METLQIPRDCLDVHNAMAFVHDHDGAIVHVNGMMRRVQDNFTSIGLVMMHAGETLPMETPRGVSSTLVATMSARLNTLNPHLHAHAVTDVPGKASI